MGEEFSHHLLIESLSKCETSSLVPLISYIVFLNGLGTKSRKKDIEYAGKIENEKGMCAWHGCYYFTIQVGVGRVEGGWCGVERMLL